VTWSSNSGARSVPSRLQQACFKRDHWTCQGCGYVGRQYKGDLHADHIVNRAEGGQDSLENLQTLCDDQCHPMKTAAERQRGQRRRTGRRRPRVHPSDVLS
jgi:5-methylcytosine-specific restriction protein A